jgi:DNA polymerase-3 subunit delta
MFYVLHGENEFGQAEELATFRSEMASGDPAMAELNTTVLEGGKLTLGELRHTCDTIPFLTDRRMVIVHGLLGMLSSSRKGREGEAAQEETPTWKRQYLKELAEYLPHLPPTTRLVFVERKKLDASHPVLKVAGREPCGHVKLYDLPRQSELPGWIQKQVRAKGGTLSSEATSMLAALVGNDLRLLDQELEKLLLYAGERQITTQDVRALVSRARQESIFDLVDCVGRRQTDRALRLLHRMLEDEAVPLYILAMLARQIRILIQAKELGAQGLTRQEMARRLKLHPFVVEKGEAQARNFTMAQLEAAHQRLLQTDWAIKTGEVEDLVALDMLVVALTRI